MSKMNQFKPKACWNLKPITSVSLKKHQKFEGPSSPPDVNIEQHFIIEKLAQKNGVYTIRIFSEPLVCSDEQYLKNFTNHLNFQKMGLEMRVDIDEYGAFIKAQNTEEMIASLNAAFVSQNNDFWETYSKTVIIADPDSFFKGIYEMNYGNILKYMHKNFELPYQKEHHRSLDSAELPTETKITLKEAIEVTGDRVLLHIHVDSLSEAFEIQKEYNIRYKSKAMQNNFESTRIYSMDGELKGLNSLHTQTIGGAVIYQKDAIIRKVHPMKSTTRLHYRVH